MQIDEFIRRDSLASHAYLVRGTSDVLYEAALRALLERAGKAGLADVWSTRTESFGIDEARELASFALLKPLHERKYLLVAAHSMTTEAQSALLKVVEDAPGHSVFFFIVEPGVPLLDTLQSRCVVVAVERDDNRELGTTFMSQSLAERLRRAEAFSTVSDREGARALVRSLLALADERSYTALQLRDLLEADRMLSLTGSSPKSVIGHLALTL